MLGSERIVVIGGGVAGLVAARALVLAGHDVELLEKSGRLGGQVASHSVAGIDVDAGADAYAVRGEALSELLRALRLSDEVVHPAPAREWLYRADGSAVPVPAESLLGIPGVPLAQDVIDVIGMGPAFRAQLDNLMPGLVASKATTLGEVVRRRMGQAVLDGLVAPVVRGSYSVSPDELDLERIPGLRGAMLRQGSLAAAVRALRASAPAGGGMASVRGGLHRIVTALEADLERFGVRVRTGAEVTDVDADGATLASGERVEGTVLVAAPLGTDAPRTRITVATIAADSPELSGAPRGTGVLVADGAPGVSARTLTHLSAKWAWIAESTPLQLLRLTYDGGVEVTPELARRDAETLLGSPLPALADVAITTWQRAGRRTGSEHAIDGMRRVGEAESGTGLATVIPYALDVVNAIPSDGERRQD